MALILCGSLASGQTNSTNSNELNASALRTLVLDSSDHLESYRFSMESEQKIDLVNLSSGDARTLYQDSFGCGLVNMTEGALRKYVTELTFTKGDEENSTAKSWEFYLVNDTIFHKEDGNWTAEMTLGVNDAWSKQNPMIQQLKILNQSDLSLMGSEMVEGQDCYELQATTDMNKMMDKLSQEAASLPPVLAMKFRELSRNLSMSSCYWITKDTYLLKKSETVLTLTATPQSLGLLGTGPAGQDMNAEFTFAGGSPISFAIAEGQGVRTSSKVSVLFYGFNESTKITLSTEAMDARSHLLDMFPMMKAIISSTIGNETG